jgi:pre-mRNA-splicing helicase BRR2
LDAAKFEEGARFMANKKCNLPRGSTKIEKKGYDEIHVPAARNMDKGERLIPISELP